MCCSPGAGVRRAQRDRSGKVVGAPEMEMMVDASLDAWLTTGRFNAAFEERRDGRDHDVAAHGHARTAIKIAGGKKSVIYR